MILIRTTSNRKNQAMDSPHRGKLIHAERFR